MTSFLVQDLPPGADIGGVNGLGGNLMAIQVVNVLVT